jgi:hypothetical protein
MRTERATSLVLCWGGIWGFVTLIEAGLERGFACLLGLLFFTGRLGGKIAGDTEYYYERPGK